MDILTNPLDDPSLLLIGPRCSRALFDRRTLIDLLSIGLKIEF
jgi:hypothetical protein